MRSLVGFFAAVVVISGIASTTLWRELRAERLLATTLQTQLSQAAAQPRTTISAAAAAPNPSAAVPVATVAMPQADVPVAPSSARPREQELWKDPEYRKARLAEIRARLLQKSPDLAQALGLSEGEANRLFDLLAEYQMTINSDLSVLNDATSNTASADFMNRQLELARQRDDKLAAQLGPAKYAQYQQYLQAAPARRETSSLSTMLVRAGQPMNAGQIKSLTAALATEIQRQRNELTAYAHIADPQDPAARAQITEAARKRQEDSNQRIVTAAAPFLNAQQLAIVRAQYEQQDAMARATARARERAQ